MILSFLKVTEDFKEYKALVESKDSKVNLALKERKVTGVTEDFREYKALKAKKENLGLKGKKAKRATGVIGVFKA